VSPISFTRVLPSTWPEGSMLEVVEGYHHNSDVVQRPSEQRILKNVLNPKSTLFVDILGVTKRFIVFHAVPHALDCVFVVHFVEYPITS
jgi:hypothetical protein